MIHFRVQDYKESWNELRRAPTTASDLNPIPKLAEGKECESSLWRSNGWYVPREKGWFGCNGSSCVRPDPAKPRSKQLAKVDGSVWRVDEPNHVTVEARGRSIRARGQRHGRPGLHRHGRGRAALRRRGRRVGLGQHRLARQRPGDEARRRLRRNSELIHGSPGSELLSNAAFSMAFERPGLSWASSAGATSCSTTSPPRTRRRTSFRILGAFPTAFNYSWSRDNITVVRAAASYKF